MIIYDIHDNVLIDPDMTLGHVDREMRYNSKTEEYEMVGRYEEYTEEELQQIASQQAEAQAKHWLFTDAQDDVELSYEAIADLSGEVSDLTDALADLSSILSEVVSPGFIRSTLL